MKETLKKFIFITSIFYAVTIVLLMLYSYSTSTVLFKFTDSKENLKKLDEYKEELKTIEDSACKSTINDLIVHYEKTSYNGEVNLKDFYFSDEGILKYAQSHFTNCELDEKEKEELSNYYVTAMLQFEETINDIRFQYEIRIPDRYNRGVIQPILNNLRYRTNRNTILDLIDTSINILKESE